MSHIAKKWTKQEIRVLRKIIKSYLRGEISILDVAKVFPGRTPLAVQRKAERLGYYQEHCDNINQEHLNKLTKSYKIMEI